MEHIDFSCRLLYCNLKKLAAALYKKWWIMKEVATDLQLSHIIPRIAFFAKSFNSWHHV